MLRICICIVYYYIIQNVVSDICLTCTSMFFKLVSNPRVYPQTPEGRTHTHIYSRIMSIRHPWVDNPWVFPRVISWVPTSFWYSCPSLPGIDLSDESATDLLLQETYKNLPLLKYVKSYSQSTHYSDESLGLMCPIMGAIPIQTMLLGEGIVDQPHYKVHRRVVIDFKWLK